MLEDFRNPKIGSKSRKFIFVKEFSKQVLTFK